MNLLIYVQKFEVPARDVKSKRAQCRDYGPWGWAYHLVNKALSWFWNKQPASKILWIWCSRL